MPLGVRLCRAPGHTSPVSLDGAWLVVRLTMMMMSLPSGRCGSRWKADRMVTDLGLLRELSGIAEPVRVGSAALGLMVHRDLDLTVVCPELSVAGVAEIGATLAGIR